MKDQIAPEQEAAMTEQEFRKAHRPIRMFDQYDGETRAMRHASHRLGFRARAAVGEFFYIHPLVPGLAFPTAKAAHLHAWSRETARVDE